MSLFVYLIPPYLPDTKYISRLSLSNTMYTVPIRYKLRKNGLPFGITQNKMIITPPIILLPISDTLNGFVKIKMSPMNINIICITAYIAHRWKVCNSNTVWPGSLRNDTQFKQSQQLRELLLFGMILARSTSLLWLLRWLTLTLAPHSSTTFGFLALQATHRRAAALFCNVHCGQVQSDIVEQEFSRVEHQIGLQLQMAANPA